MIDYGDDWDYAKSRLRDSIVLLNKEPVVIYNINDCMFVSCGELDGTEKSNVYHITKFDLTPFPLGFANTHNGSVSKLMRKASRYYKQGLSNDNFWFKGGKVSLYSKPVFNVIVNEYPNLFKAYEDIYCKEAECVAISRKFFIRKGDSEEKIPLYYEWEEVGSVMPSNTGQIMATLDEDFMFLSEALEEGMK